MAPQGLGARVLEARVRSGSERFFRWYRTLPLLAMGVVLALALGVGALPNNVVRRVFYPVSYATQINGSAARHDVDPCLVAAVIKCESDWDPSAQSGAGAVGLMQLMPETAQELADLGVVDAAEYDVSRLTDPSVNIEYGTAYLAYLSQELGSTDEVIAAYNAGLGTVRSWLADGTQGVAEAITYPETRLYLQRVKQARDRYAELYPEGLEDF